MSTPDSTHHHQPQVRTAWLRIGVPSGAALFIVALAVSAIVVPQLRPLHFFQGLIYVSVILLARRGSAWGLGAGVTVPAVWNCLQLFVTHLTQTGALLFWRFLQTGELRGLDTMMVTLGWIGHSVLMASSLVAFVRAHPGTRAWKQFAAGGAVALIYFGLIAATLVPP
jgi:hypothetical protein